MHTAAKHTKALKLKCDCAGTTSLLNSQIGAQMKKRALIVGCNYPGSSAPLRGCVNDAHTMRALLVEHFGFDPADITLMLDTDPSTTSPTGANIKASTRRPLCWPARAHHAGQSAEF